MAGRISWQIEFQGIDANLTKLREMDRLLNGITRKGGSVGAGGGVNVGGNVNVGGGSNASTAAAAAAGASIGSGGGLTATQQLRQKQKSHYSTYRQAMQARKLFMSNLYASFIRPPIRFGNAFPPATGNPLTDFFRQGGPLSKAFGAIGNSVVKYMVGPLMQMHKAIGNYFIHPLHNLITGKLNITRTIGAQLPLLGKVSSLYLAKWFAPGDMKSGMGRAIAALSFLPGMSRVAAVFSKFGILGVGVAAAFIALLAATYALTKGIKAGAEAYENAAKLGKGVAQTSQLQGALSMLGINEQASEMMLLRGQMAERRGGRGGGLNYNEQADAMISAARVSGFGSAQQLANMPKEFAEALKDAAANSEEMAQSAHINLELNMELASIARELKTALAQLAAACAPLIEAFLLVAKLSLAEFNRELYIVIAGLQWIGKKLGLNVAATQPGTNIVSPGGSGAAQSAWEKMGFIIGAKGPDKALNNISNNSNKTVGILQGILTHLRQSGRMGGSSILNLLPLPSTP